MMEIQMKFIRNFALGALAGFLVIPFFGIVYDIAFPMYEWIFPSLESSSINFIMYFSLIPALIGGGIGLSIPVKKTVILYEEGEDQ